MKKIYLSLTLVALLTACSKTDDLNPDSVLLGMGGDTWVKTALDEWLYREFVVPYNMEIKYKWDPYEFSLSKTFVPVDESKVQDVMTVVKEVWIKPYEKVAGGAFIKTLAPKRYVLVGTVEYNADGTLTLGFAEGGNTIVLLGLNTFNIKSVASIKNAIETIEHEFAHTLHQTTLYPEEFATYCRDSYTSAWKDTPSAEFRGLGFVSQYSRSNSDEDFAEMVRYILLEGRTAFDNYVNGSPEPGRSRLRSKEAIIVNYFKQVWKIDLYETYADAKDGLVDITQQAIADVIANH